MCGICGIWTGGRRADDQRVAAMMGAITHRGPDSDGRLRDGPLDMGMRRLRIIDLLGGEQPIHNEDRTIGAILNGEIYNFRALRRELTARGHAFATRSDTETIVHGYEEWGDEVLAHLRGMFAFALWDGRERRLLIARDRFGKKPLYYARTGGELLFASEIKALLAAGVSSDLDPLALEAVLDLRYVPTPRTMFAAVRQLPAGHLMAVDAAGPRVRRWWRLDYQPKHAVTLEEAEAETERLLRESIELRLVSDVPLGCFLSGGLDSSVLLALMTEISGGPVETFSVGFAKGWASDELPAAALVAGAFGARQHAFRLGPVDFLELLPTAIWHRDEPLAEPSEVPLLALSRRAREHVTVVLSGEGGDELFGGYPKYRVDRLVAALARVARPALARGGYRRALDRLPLPRRLRLLLGLLGLPEAADRWPAWFGAELGARHGAIAPRTALQWALSDRPAGLAGLDAMMALDVDTYLVDNLLVRGDKMTMAASIEGRMPFLDHHLAEYVARLPMSMKAVPRETKVLTRRIARRLLPAELVARPKVGFAVPVASWFRGELGRAAEELLVSEGARRRGIVPVAHARRLLRRHRGGVDFGKELWTLLNLELWSRVFLDREPPEELAERLRAAV